jgi:hypothetical protein
MPTTRRLRFPHARPTRRPTRLALVAVAVVVAVLLAFRLGVGVYVNSSRGKAAVGKELQSMFGMPVEVADVDLGARTSAVRFRVLAPDAGRAEVLSVESAAADVSFAEVVASRIAPKHIDLSGVALTLRVGEDGTIQTPIPPVPDGPSGTLPRVVVERGRVAVWRDGHPEFAVAGIGVRVEPTGDAVRLTGVIDDAAWGRWSIAGHLDRPTRTGWVEFTTARELPWEQLRTIPFVPAGAWYGVEMSGGLTIRVTFDGPTAPRFEVKAAK